MSGESGLLSGYKIWGKHGSAAAVLELRVARKTARVCKGIKAVRVHSSELKTSCSPGMPSS